MKKLGTMALSSALMLSVCMVPALADETVAVKECPVSIQYDKETNTVTASLTTEQVTNEIIVNEESAFIAGEIVGAGVGGSLYVSSNAAGIQGKIGDYVGGAISYSEEEASVKIDTEEASVVVSTTEGVKVATKYATVEVSEKNGVIVDNDYAHVEVGNEQGVIVSNDYVSVEVSEANGVVVSNDYVDVAVSEENGVSVSGEKGSVEVTNSSVALTGTNAAASIEQTEDDVVVTATIKDKTVSISKNQVVSFAQKIKDIFGQRK